MIILLQASETAAEAAKRRDVAKEEMVENQDRLKSFR